MSDSLHRKIKLKAPHHGGSYFIEDVEYRVDETGHIYVQPHHADKLYLHGFMNVHEANLTDASGEKTFTNEPLESPVVEPVQTQESKIVTDDLDVGHLKDQKKGKGHK